jgi:hypothetical protein
MIGWRTIILWNPLPRYYDAGNGVQAPAPQIFIKNAHFGEIVAVTLYSTKPMGQVFIRSHDRPGYSWSMDEWNAESLRRPRPVLPVKSRTMNDTYSYPAD